MVRVLEATKGYKPLPLAAVTPGGEILAVLVAARVQTLPRVFGAVSARSIWYAEPLCHDDVDSIDALCGLIVDHDRAMHRRVLFTEVRPLHAAGPERVALERCGYEYLDYLNYVIDTTRPKDELWKRMSDSARKNIRKCERRGFQIRHVNTADSVEQFYDLLKLTYGRAEVPLAHRSLFDAALNILRPPGMIEFIALYEEEKPLAVSVILPFNKQVFGWYGGSVRIQGVTPVDYLTWHEIAWSCDHGIARYDFGGAGWPDKPYGVREYKARFGGDLVCYGRYRKIYSRWKLALAERAYELGRGVVSPK
jgi:CelD/BcsL family acetyltransferase involved in cellulose biosynthesis